MVVLVTVRLVNVPLKITSAPVNPLMVKVIFETNPAVTGFDDIVKTATLEITWAPVVNKPGFPQTATSAPPAGCPLEVKTRSLYGTT